VCGETVSAAVAAAAANVDAMSVNTAERKAQMVAIDGLLGGKALGASGCGGQ